MFLMAIAMASLVSCGVWDNHPPCDTCTTCSPRSDCSKSSCGEGKVDITLEPTKVDRTNEFVGGLICVISNLSDLSYLIDDDQNVDSDSSDKTPPELHYANQGCLLRSEGSYTIEFSKPPGYKKAPSVKGLPLEKGEKYTVNAQLAPSQ